MRHINYNHLLYFWTVYQEGGVTAAAEKLNLTPQTISGQIKLLEDMIGESLFERSGRLLKITPTGKLVAEYAQEIFSLGSELTQRIKSKSLGPSRSLNVGIVNSIPKLISYRILRPLIEQEEAYKISCYESDLEHLLADLALHKLDVVISDKHLPSGLNIKAFSHSLGTSTLAFFGHPSLIAQYHHRPFPDMLNDAPVIMPAPSNALRQSLDNWLEQKQIQCKVVAEFDDSALLKVFGQAAVGFFAVPASVAHEVEAMYSVKKVGNIESIQEHYYIITPERHIKHPAVIQITQENSLKQHQ